MNEEESILKSTKIDIDVNAHIEKLKCDIVKQNDEAYAIIAFDNLGFGNISAIKFDACGYNSFGDIVNVNGQEKFFLIVQDVDIKRNEHVTDLKAKLPNADIKKLDMQECQICYADGTVVSYAGEDKMCFEVEEIENSERKEAIKKIYGKKAKYKVKEFEKGWICTCGRYNSNENSRCSLCENEKEDLFLMSSEEGMNQIMDKYNNIREEEKKLKRIEEAKKKKKKNRHKKVGIIVGIIGVIIIFMMPNIILKVQTTVTMSKRQIYNSVNEMRIAMQGNWSHKSDYNDNILWQLQIIGNKGVKVYASTTDTSECEISWNPSKGTFKAGNITYVVDKGGQTIEEENGSCSYDKGGYTMTPGVSESSDSDSSSSYESAYSALNISDIYVSSNSSYTVCTGKVTNNGEFTYKFVSIKGVFKDAFGTVVDTDSTYAVGSEGLAPGESKSFRMSVRRDSTIEDCSVSITDYDN